MALRRCPSQIAAEPAAKRKLVWGASLRDDWVVLGAALGTPQLERVQRRKPGRKELACGETKTHHERFSGPPSGLFLCEGNELFLPASPLSFTF